MDPEKVLSQIKKALGLEDGATREQILKALDGIAALQEAREGKKDDKPEAPEEPAEAARETPEEAVAATDEPAEEAEVVEAAVEPVVEAAEEPGMDPMAGEALAAIGILAEASGMSPEEIIAALREKADAVVGALGGEPAAPATEPAMSRGASDALKASKARIEALEAARKKDATTIAALTKRLDDADAKGDQRRVDDAIAAGHILPGHRSLFLALARSDRAEFDAQLTAATASPAVPTGDVATGKGSQPGPDAVTPDEDDPHLVQLAKTLRNARVSEARIKAELAKAKAKHFEGRA